MDETREGSLICRDDTAFIPVDPEVESMFQREPYPFLYARDGLSNHSLTQVGDKCR